MTKKSFTFDNGRKGQGSAVSRIDKFLVSQELDTRGGRIEVAPSIRKISDHSPLVLTIWGRHSGPYTLASYFDRNLQQKITLAEVQLQRDPEDEPIREILSMAQGHLADTLQEKVARNHQLSSASWFRYGDTCSKRFFDFHCIGRKRTPLKELKTEGGDITGQEDLAHYVRSFYERLYTSEADAPNTLEAREDCWESTPSRVSDLANDELTKDLTLKEIKEAIAAMPKGKAPGSDGIPTEFFQELVEEISPTLL
jgi:hypothetical protein